MNSYPAGYSSEEDEFDDFGFQNERPRRNQAFIPRILTPEEKLIDAVCNNDVNAAKEALDEGADVHHRSSFSMNYSPIMKAASFGAFEVMELLISRGANVNDDFEMFNVIMCLCNASLQDETVLLKCLNLLLENGADPLATDWVGATSVMNAVRRGRQLLVAKLLESGCSVNASDGEGWTPLFYAVQTGNINMTKFLIESGGNINSLSRFGLTLWEHAASKNDADLSALVTPKELMESDEDEVVKDLQPCASYFKLLMSEAPKIGDRMFGYHEDAILFIRGIGLDNVASLMDKRNIQFSELLTWNESDWIEAGVRLSYPLRKIDLCVRKYHEKEWGKGSIPNVTQVVSKENEVVELFAVVQQLLSCLRNVHICSATSLYVLKNYDEPLTVEMEEDLNNTLKTITVIQKQLRLLRSITREIDNPTLYPPDLIAPDRTRTPPLRLCKEIIMDYLCRNAVHIVVHVLWNSV